MRAELVEIRQTTRRTAQAVLAKIHEPLRPANKRKPSVESQVEILKAALERLIGLIPDNTPAPAPPKRRLRAERSIKAVPRPIVEPVPVDDFLPLSRDPGQRDQEITGCKTLLLEIIRRAAYDWVLYRTSHRMLHRMLAEQAYTWIFVEAPPHPDWIERAAEGKELTSFASICEQLDLQPEVVRSYIRRLQPKNVMSVGRPAEYRRKEPPREVPASLPAHATT
jgi:hypothetical protein